MQSAGAPDGDDTEPVFPAAWRTPVEEALGHETPAGVNWRFRVPDGRVVEFTDLRAGPRRFVAGVDFGDFLVWNRDVPANSPWWPTTSTWASPRSCAARIC
ncbi:MAG: hypothetical protein U1F77_16240 [Kiritimatiellia bacterium]